MLTYVFPAPAGVIPNPYTTTSTSIGFPRTCGGDPVHLYLRFFSVWFSPHLRG